MQTRLRKGTSCLVHPLPMKTRIIYTDIHEDDYYRSLTDREQNFYLFLHTNSRVNLTGIYRCPEWYVLASKPNWTAADLKIMKDKFQSDGKFRFYEDWVMIIEYSKYDVYHGTKNEAAKKREREEAPKELFNSFLLGHSIDIENLDTVSIEARYPINTLSNEYTKGIDTVSNIGDGYPIDTPRNNKSEIRNQEQETRNKESEIKIDTESNSLQDAFNEINKKIEEPTKGGITYSWQDKALRCATELGIDLTELDTKTPVANYRARWMKLFELADDNQQQTKIIDKLYTYCIDKPEFSGRDSLRKFLYFMRAFNQLNTSKESKGGEF